MAKTPDRHTFVKKKKYPIVIYITSSSTPPPPQEKKAIHFFCFTFPSPVREPNCRIRNAWFLDTNFKTCLKQDFRKDPQATFSSVRRYRLSAKTSGIREPLTTAFVVGKQVM